MERLPPETHKIALLSGCEMANLSPIFGKDGKILFIDTGVKTKSHGEDVAAKLAELGVDEK